MHVEPYLLYGLSELIVVLHADELGFRTYASALISCALSTANQVSDGDVLSSNNPSFRNRGGKAGKHASRRYIPTASPNPSSLPSPKSQHSNMDFNLTHPLVAALAALLFPLIIIHTLLIILPLTLVILTLLTSITIIEHSRHNPFAVIAVITFFALVVPIRVVIALDLVAVVNAMRRGPIVDVNQGMRDDPNVYIVRRRFEGNDRARGDRNEFGRREGETEEAQESEGSGARGEQNDEKHFGA